MTDPIRHRVAVLGSPIEHSRSPVLHSAGFDALGLHDWAYTRIETEAEDLARVVGEADESFVGFSVTMPAKFAALEFADAVTPRAELVGSANTLVRVDGGWQADNTDTEGVLGALHELYRGDLSGVSNPLLIGSGGTARPALWALAELGITDVTILNRSDRSADLADVLAALGMSARFVNFEEDVRGLSRECDLIVSTVPSAAVAGFENDLGHAPVLDVIYDPWPTPLTVRAAANGYSTVGGHVMLAHQSYPQFEAFTGREAPRPQMWQALIASLS